MIATPEIVTTAPQHFAGIRLLVPTSEIRQHMAAGCKEIAAALKSQGIRPTGPWFTHHFRRPSDTFDYEICFPVDTPVQPEGRVQPGFWAPTHLVRTVYHGSYAQLARSWGDLHQWTTAQGLATREEFWEVYLVNPETEANPDNYRTQLNWQLAE